MGGIRWKIVLRKLLRNTCFILPAALKLFQEFNNDRDTITGEVSMDDLMIMKLPRCGVPGRFIHSVTWPALFKLNSHKAYFSQK